MPAKRKPPTKSRGNGRGRRDQSRLTRLRALYKISDILTTTQRSETVLKSILKEAVKVTRATSGSLILLDRERGVLNIKIATNLNPKVVDRLKLKLGEGVTGWVALKGTSLRVGDVRRSLHYVSVKPTIKSELAVPLIIGGEVVGVINVDSDRRDAFTEEDEELLVAIAAQSSKVMQAANSNEENRRRASRLSTLFNVAKAVVSEPFLDDVLRRVADEVRRLMEAAVCSIMLLDEGEENFEMKAVSGRVAAGYIDRKSIPVKDNVIGRVIETRKPLYLPDVREEKQYRLAKVARESGLCSLLSIPMIFVGKMIGVLNIYTTDPTVFSDEDVALMTAFAGHSAVAIVNAQRYERIFRSEELLRESEKFQLLGTLSAEIAHEIRNPLTILGVLAHTIREDSGLSEAGRRDLEVMRTKIDDMNQIVDQVLDFARSRQTEAVPVDLNEVIDDVHMLIGYKAGSLGLKVRVRHRDDLPSVGGVPGQLGQALLNLALNGLEAMREGGNILHLSTRQLRREGRDWVGLRVRDEGCGIPEEKMKEIFSPYFSMKDSGTGLGLFITRRIVTEHGGELKVKSAPGEGSTFEILLPAAEPGEAATTTPAAGAARN